MRRLLYGYTKLTILLIASVLICIIACSQYTARQTGQGAATGAVIGAVGGLMSGLVFGGNAAEAAARGAFLGAGTGAASGAMSGAIVESNRKAQTTDNLKVLRAKIGDDAYHGVEALVNCKHDVASAYGRTAATSGNLEYALAGLWLQVLTLADSRHEDKARALFPQLIIRDKEINDTAQAEAKMRRAMQKLMEIREQHNLAGVCL